MQRKYRQLKSKFMNKSKYVILGNLRKLQLKPEKKKLQFRLSFYRKKPSQLPVFKLLHSGINNHCLKTLDVLLDICCQGENTSELWFILNGTVHKKFLDFQKQIVKLDQKVIKRNLISLKYRQLESKLQYKIKHSILGKLRQLLFKPEEKQLRL